MSASLCRCEKLRTCFTNEASTSATKRYEPDGTGLARCLRQKSGRSERMRTEIGRNGAGIWMRYSSPRGEIARLHRGFLRKVMKRFGNPIEIVTDRLRAYRAAMREIGNEARQATGRWLNNRVENSHQPSGDESEQWQNLRA